MHIRQYLPTDAAHVFELHRQAMQSAGVQKILTGFWENDLRQIEESYMLQGEFYVGVLDGKIIAMGGIRPAAEKEVAELRRLRVHPDHQRRGYGEAILDRLERKAQELGYKTIVLNVGLQQVPAHQLYKKRGYKETHRGEIAGIPVIYYRKDLPVFTKSN